MLQPSFLEPWAPPARPPAGNAGVGACHRRWGHVTGNARVGARHRQRRGGDTSLATPGWGHVTGNAGVGGHVPSRLPCRTENGAENVTALQDLLFHKCSFVTVFAWCLRPCESSLLSHIIGGCPGHVCKFSLQSQSCLYPCICGPLRRAPCNQGPQVPTLQ